MASFLLVVALALIGTFMAVVYLDDDNDFWGK